MSNTVQGLIKKYKGKRYLPEPILCSEIIADLQALEHIQQPEKQSIETCKECGIFVFTTDGKMCMNGHTRNQPTPTEHIQHTEDEKPNMEKYGWHTQNGFDDEPSGWMIEGGEEAYYEALKKWEQAQPTEEKLMVQTAEIKTPEEILFPYHFHNFDELEMIVRIEDAAKAAIEYHAQFAADQIVSLFEPDHPFNRGQLYRPYGHFYGVQSIMNEWQYLFNDCGKIKSVKVDSDEARSFINNIVNP